MKTVEVLKIGSVMPVLPIKGRIYDTSQFKYQTIMVVSDGGDLYDHYVSILRKACESEYKLLKTEKGIFVGTSSVFRLGNQPNIKGTSYSDPVVGSSYSLDSWTTTKVEKVIDGCIIITKNSVYALHNASEFRDRKLNELGI